MRSSEPGSSPTSSSGSGRCRRASRCGPGWPPPGPIRSWSTRAAPGTTRPGRRRRSSGPTRPTSPPGGRRASARIASRRRPGSRPSPRRGEAIGAELDGLDTLTEPGLHSTLGDAHADGDLVYTASSMPIRDQEAFLGAVDADALFLCNRGANGLDGLVSSGVGAAAATGQADDDRHRRPRPPPRPRSPRRPARGHDPGPDRRHRQRRRRDLPLPPPGDGSRHRRVRGPARHPARRLHRSRAASLFELPHHRLGSLEELPEALAAGTSLIEVRTDRHTNVELHRRLADRVSAAVASLVTGTSRPGVTGGRFPDAIERAGAIRRGSRSRRSHPFTRGQTSTGLPGCRRGSRTPCAATAAAPGA